MTRALDRRSIDHAVIGGIANFVWGEVRGTRDLDFSVDLSGREAVELADLARELGEPAIPNAVDFAERSRVFPVRLPGGIVVDFILATLPFELEAIKRARKINFEGIQMRIVAPEDFIIYKAISSRSQDYRDIVGVLRRQDDLNIDKLDRDIQSWSAELEDPTIIDRWQNALKESGR